MLPEKNNWGQININSHSKGQMTEGGFLILEYQKSFSPPQPSAPLNDRINVDLTPIILQLTMIRLLSIRT